MTVPMDQVSINLQNLIILKIHILRIEEDKKRISVQLVELEKESETKRGKKWSIDSTHRLLQEKEKQLKKLVKFSSLIQGQPSDSPKKLMLDLRELEFYLDQKRSLAAGKSSYASEVNERVGSPDSYASMWRKTELLKGPYSIMNSGDVTGFASKSGGVAQGSSRQNQNSSSGRIIMNSSEIKGTLKKIEQSVIDHLSKKAQLTSEGIENLMKDLSVVQSNLGSVVFESRIDNLSSMIRAS